MVTTFPLSAFQVAPTVFRFEGAPHAAACSFFLVHTLPGGGTGNRHTHPYAEVFVLQEGRAAYHVGDEVLHLEAGAVMVVPAGTPHGFTNIGDVPLVQLSIHDGGRIVQHELDEAARTEP